MKNRFKILSCWLALAAGAAQLAADESFSPPAPPRPVVLMDYYHRTPKGTTIGKHLLTGSYMTTVGRYQTDDFSHTNSYDSFLNALERDFDLRIHKTPLIGKNLEGADIVLLINPEKPTPEAPVPVLSEEEISDLVAFVDRGGTVVALLNSVGKAGTEEFETVQMKKLMNAVGLDWNNVNTEYSDIPLGALNGYFYDIPVFHYGAGCTLKFLPSAQQPQVLLNVKEDNGAEQVHGPGVVLVRHGKGKFLCFADTGSWGGGNMSRPWAENRKFLKQMFGYAKATQGITPPLLPARETLRYKVQLGQLLIVPTGHPLAAVPQPDMEFYRPRPKTGLPYSETEGTLELQRVDATDDGPHQTELRFGELSRNGKPLTLTARDQILVDTTRQGALIDVRTAGEISSKIVPDIDALFAFVPNDAIRIGDRWQKIQPVRVNPLQGGSRAVTKRVEVEMVYVRDEEIAGRPCRLIRSQAEVWLSDIGATIDDIVPADVAQRWAGAKFEFVAGRGGRILLKKEQWIDARSGVVVKADTQTRLLAWIHRVDEILPIKTADKDNLMMVALASMASFSLEK